MELDKLQTRWQARDKKIDEVLEINRQLLRHTRLGRANTNLRRLSRWLVVELVVGVVVTLLLGGFLADNVAQTRFLVAVVPLHVVSILLVVATVRQLHSLRRIDYDGPILTTQKRLEALQVEDLRVVLYILVLSPLLWTPFLIVVLQGVFEIDAYAVFSSRWLGANVLFGIFVLVMAIALSRRYADRMQGSPTVQRVMRNLTGENLKAALDDVDELARFEQEKS